MSESAASTPDATVSVDSPRARDAGARASNPIYQALAWIGIVVGALFIVAVIFLSGLITGAAAGGGWHHGFRNTYGWSNDSDGGCPMMGSDGSRMPDDRMDPGGPR